MKINVAHVAKLANLSISKDEEEKLEKQLTDVLTYVDKLKEVDTSSVTPTSQVTGLENVLREDETGASLPQEKALENAPAEKNGFFQVKGIFNQE